MTPTSWYSLRPDAELLDEWPPFLDIDLHPRAERLRRLLLARGGHAQIGNPRLHRRIGQRSYRRRIELADDALRRTDAYDRLQRCVPIFKWQTEK